MSRSCAPPSRQTTSARSLKAFAAPTSTRSSSIRAAENAAPSSGSARTRATGATTGSRNCKQDQRSLHADVAVIVSATLRKGCDKFGVVDGVLVTDFACAPALATIVRLNLCQLAQLRQATISKEEKLELLYQYLSGVEFRQRVEAVVEAFTAMRHDLEQERRAAERQWARRSKQIDSVTFNISGMYGDLQGLLPALPSIALLELPEADEPLLAAP